MRIICSSIGRTFVVCLEVAILAKKIGYIARPCLFNSVIFVNGNNRVKETRYRQCIIASNYKLVLLSINPRLSTNVSISFVITINSFSRCDDISSIPSYTALFRRSWHCASTCHFSFAKPGVCSRHWNTILRTVIWYF